jgi:tRNA 2-selenouridine synthase
MPERLDIKTFMDRASRVPLVDVRSPGEFAQGHIPGAANVPLFSDAERAEIGTTYVQQGRHEAIQLGLARVGPRLAQLGEQVRALASESDGELLIHCWRGGMRSASVAWLAETLDCHAATLIGGYKSFRRWAAHSTGVGRKVCVVAGMTGTGKTCVLQALAECGESVIDLERLAHHKGSAFGDLGEEAQPTQEQFENELAMAWLKTQPDAPVWLEDESRNIGRRTLPAALWQAKQEGHFHVLEFPDEMRLAHLEKVYCEHPPEVLVARLESIRKRLGGEQTAAAVRAVRAGDLGEACRLVLFYYDRAYSKALQRVPPGRVRVFSFDHVDYGAIAELLRRSALP